MKLNRRYLRSIRNNLSFYISSAILTVMTLFLFFTLNIAGEAIWEFGDRFFATQHLEDANFTTYLPISKGEAEELEKEYSVSLEAQFYSNVETEGTTARVFQRTKEINLYTITEGRDAEKPDEIILSEGYAVFHRILPGQRITVGEKEYTVTGFFQRPDYLYMLENEDDSYKNITTFFLACVTDDAFRELGKENCIYFVRYHEDNQTEFRREINGRYYMRSYLSAEDNMRIHMVKWQAEMFIVMSYIILAVMPLIVVVLVSIVMNRKVKSEQKLIGTLTALGYRKSRVLLHYAGFAVIPGLSGGILGVLFTVIFAQSFGELCLADYEPMRIECRLNPLAAVLGIMIPTGMYLLAAVRSVNKLLKKNTVLLLNDSAGQGGRGYGKILVKNRVSFRVKYALRSLVGNPSRTFVVFLGIFLGSFIALLGRGFIDTMDDTKKSIADGTGSYEYQYVLNELADGKEYGGEPILVSRLENEAGKQFSLIGTTDSNPYLILKDKNGSRVSLGEGYYVTSVMALLLDLQAGDIMALRNPLTLEEVEITVAGILDNDMQTAIFGSRENVAEIMGVSGEVSNVIMSHEALDIPDSKIIQTLKRTDAREQIQNISNQMNVMIYLLIGVGAIICMASIYVAINMLVSENRGTVSMLKVLGYRDGQINRIVLRVNHILLPIGFFCGIPPVFASIKWFMAFLAEFMGVLPKACIAPESLIYTAALVCMCYFGSLFLLRRKVSKVDMVESLKGNRE